MAQILLQQALEMDNLRLAWEEVAENKGMPGVDEVSILAWRRNWEERLVALRQAVRRNAYRPHKLRQRRIPKRSRREFRLLRIPTVTDRVLQRAVLQVLYPVFEPRFLDCSYGYRPQRGLVQAVERILVLRENGFRWVVDADIDEFFDSVDLDLLMEFLSRDLPDDSLLPLIRGWLELGASDTAGRKGIALGSPLSPLWANVFLHRLDWAITGAGYPLVRYADDFVIFAISQEQAEQIYWQTGEALKVLKLRYEPSKTRLVSFEEGFTFLGVHFERDTYTFTYRDKPVSVRGAEVDWLFSDYLPDYE